MSYWHIWTQWEIAFTVDVWESVEKTSEKLHLSRKKKLISWFKMYNLIDMIEHFCGYAKDLTKATKTHHRNHTERKIYERFWGKKMLQSEIEWDDKFNTDFEKFVHKNHTVQWMNFNEWIDKRTNERTHEIKEREKKYERHEPKSKFWPSNFVRFIHTNASTLTFTWRAFMVHFK